MDGGSVLPAVPPTRNGSRTTMARPILLVGSAPLPTTRDALATVAETIGNLVERIPDGEVSKVRLGWIQCQRDTLVKATGLEIEGQRTVPGYKYNAYRIASNSNASDVRFGSLGYADWARDSYAEFRRLKQAGNIAQPTRFQVCLPAPFDVCSAFIVPSDMKAVWLACEHAMAAELEKIAQAILAEELAVQWDMVHEFIYVMEKP